MMMTRRSDPVAVFDWGTTHLRAYVVDGAGHIQKTIQRDSGIKTDSANDIRHKFNDVIIELEATFGPLPCVLVGMIGSNFGWQEVAMQAGPMTAAALARTLVEIQGTGGRQAVIVPGVTAPSVVGAPDMMRGEETQVFGALGVEQAASCTICLPGTHTKWVQCEGGAITGITTAMTGEMFDMLQDHSVLKGTLAGASTKLNEAAFDEGVALGASGLGALQLAFSTRAKSLSQTFASPDAAASYLSGLMIGAEVTAMTPYLKGDLTVVGTPDLGDLYKRALAPIGVVPQLIDGSAAVASGAQAIYYQYSA